MNVGIRINRLGRDDDFDQFQITIADGVSLFACSAYIGHRMIPALASQLENYPSTIAGSSMEFELGSFDAKAAGGALHVKLQAQATGKVLLSAHAQGEHFEFGQELVATVGSAYLVSEPVLIDNFIAGLRLLISYEENAAFLEAQNFRI